MTNDALKAIAVAQQIDELTTDAVNNFARLLNSIRLPPYAQAIVWRAMARKATERAIQNEKAAL